MADIEVMTDAEEAEIPLEEEPEEEERVLVYDDDSPNLVRDFMDFEEGREFLKKVAMKVKDDFDRGYADSQQYRERFKNDWKLFSGELPPKDFPNQYSANAHVPVMLENLSRLTARASSELYGDWQNVFGVVPMGPEQDSIAETLNRHGNWQIREQIPDFRRQMGDRYMLAFFWIGDVTVHSYYDPERQQNRHEVLTPDEFVVPFTFTSTMPDYSDVPWRCKIVNYYRHQMEARRGEWFDVDKLLAGERPSWDDSPEQEIASTVAEVQGTDTPESDGDPELGLNAPYKLLWYEGWMRLPNQDSDRLVQVIMHDASSTLLKMVIHEETDWQDAERFRRQEAELKQYREAQIMHSVALTQLEQQQQVIMQAGADGVAGPELVNQGLEQIKQRIPEQPLPPTWMQNPDDPMEGPVAPRKVPIHLFTHCVCIENFVGIYGLSYGRMQADHNRAINVLLSQFIDTGTLANVPALLATDSVDFGGVKAIAPGDVVKVKGLIGGELRNNIMELPTKPANSQLLQVMELLQRSAQTSMQAPEVLSGEPGKSGETYRGISARIEQATKQLSVYTRKAADGLEQVLKNNAKLNAKFLKDEEIVYIAETAMGPRMPVKVGRQMYERDYKIQIRSDLRFATQAQRIAESDELMGIAGKVPQLMQNPAFVYKTLTKVLRARGMDDMIQLLGQAPPPPQVFGEMPQPPPGQAPPGGMPPGGAQPQPGMPQ